MDESNLIASREQEKEAPEAIGEGGKEPTTLHEQHQWLSNFGEQQIQLEGWLTHQLPGPTPRVSELEGCSGPKKFHF